MNIETNEPLVKRNTRIAQVAMIGGLAVLAGGMYISFSMPERFTLSLAALMVGFVLSQVGIYYSNRWSRRPRPDEVINKALKGLDGRHTLYHYIAPVRHLLVGPRGLWILIPMHQSGKISYAKGRWKQRGGNFYMKIFAQESLGRPDLDVAADVETMQNFLKQKLGEDSKIPDIQAALVFFNPKAEVLVNGDTEAPAYTVKADDLKDLVRKKSKQKSISPEIAKQIQDLIEYKS
ncbi:MAG: hypothetical protein P8Z00_15665 [Anaerolineales bacterium]|jgi:hypothetical protein